MTIQDPFDPTNESQPFSEPAAPETKPTVTFSDKPAPAAPVSEGKVVLTFKGGRDFDAPWIVIHAADLQDAHNQVTYNAVLLSKLMEQVQKAGQHFSSQGKKPDIQQLGGAAPQRQAPQGATEAPSWAGQAPDGYKYATGVKNGRTWHAWFPIERDSNLEKIWLNPPK